MIVARKLIRPAVAHGQYGARLEVNVLCSTDVETSAALKAAAAYAGKLDALIRVVAFNVVPYPLEITKPCVAPDFTVQHWAGLVQKLNLDANVQIFYCRDLASGVAQALNSGSLVVIGRARRWWMPRENPLVRLVRSAKHDLLCVDVR